MNPSLTPNIIGQLFFNIGQNKKGPLFFATKTQE